MAGPFARWDVTEEESSACRDSDHEVEILWAGDSTLLETSWAGRFYWVEEERDELLLRD